MIANTHTQIKHKSKRMVNQSVKNKTVAAHASLQLVTELTSNNNLLNRLSVRGSN